jgi:hypothetical protein
MAMRRRPGGFDAPVIRKPYDVTQVAAAVAELLAVNGRTGNRHPRQGSPRIGGRGL